MFYVIRDTACKIFFGKNNSFSSYFALSKLIYSLHKKITSDYKNRFLSFLCIYVLSRYKCLKMKIKKSLPNKCFHVCLRKLTKYTEFSTSLDTVSNSLGKKLEAIDK